MLLRNIRYLVTQDDDRTVREHVDVRVDGGEIVAIGDDLDRDGTVIDCSGKAVLPGLVNAHTHASMTLLRGISDDRVLQEWLFDDILPAESVMDRDDVELGARLAIAEMLLSGTTCFNDMYAPEDAVAAAVDDTGMRAVLGRGLIDSDGEGAEKLRESRALLDAYADHPRITPAVAPHAVYTCSPDILDRAREQADRFDAPVHVHLSETVRENEDCQEEHGRSPAEHLDAHGLLTDRTVAAHGTHLSQGSIDLLAERGASVVHNPAANLKLGSGVAPVPALLDAGVTVGLGTDGVASNNSLDMFDEMKLASLVQKEQDPTVLPAQQALDMATRGSAAALGLDGRIGSVETGKRADLVAVDLSHPSMTPVHGPRGVVSNLVFAFDGRVSDVLVDGDVLVRDGEPVDIDLDGLGKEAQRRADRIRADR